MKNKQKKKLTEEEKKKKFGDNYDPNFKPKPRKKDDKPPEPKPNEGIKQDWEWYALSEEIAKQLGGFSYSDLSGVAKFVPFISNSQQQPQEFQWISETVMRIGYIPAQFTSGDSVSAISKAATQLYVFLRHVNSGARNYEQADLMMVILAMRDIYREFLEIKRAIGVAKYFNYFNRAVPECLQTALRIDFTDLIQNIAQYTGTLNILANDINSVAIPKYFKAFERQALISSVVFADSDSMRGQFFVYDADGYYTYSATTSEQGTELIFKQKSANAETIATRLARLNSMLEAVLADTDANTITGDVLHAFKDSEVYVLTQIPADYMVTPVFNENLLAQVENAIALSFYGVTAADLAAATAAGTLNVTQSGGQISWTPQFERKGSTAVDFSAFTQFLFNSHKDEVDYKDNLEWSRLIAVATPLKTQGSGTDTTKTLLLIGCGLELTTSFTIYRGAGQNPLAISQRVTSVGAQDMFALLRLMEYDWHPTIYYSTPDGLAVGADVKKYVWVTQDLIRKIHDAANNASFTSLDLYALRR